MRERFDDLMHFVDMVARAALERLTTGVLFNPNRPDMHVDPYPAYHALRERDPVHRSYPASGWVLTRYDDILAVLGDRSFSADERNWTQHRRIVARERRAGLPGLYETGIISMLRLDPPDHTRLRTLVAKAFTPRAVERMRPRIAALVDELLDGLAGRGEIDLMRELASPLPVAIIAEMLGVSVDDRERFRRWSNDAIQVLGDTTLPERMRAWQAIQEMGAWLEHEATARRAAPRDDLLSGLVAAEEAGDRLSQTELLSTCVLLLVAGNETTTNLIGNGLLALLRHPDQLALLRREPQRIPAAVEEMLRYDSPVQLTSRIVLEDRRFAGRRFRRGQQIVLLLAAGNRDPARFAAPDRFDMTRDDIRPLSFSHGLHYCLGAQLARLEAQIVFERLLARFPGLQLGSGEIAWTANTVLRGPRVLPIVAEPAGASAAA